MDYVDLLAYLGKQISFIVPSEYQPLGYYAVNGQVISVCIELNGHHQICVDSGDSADVYYYAEMSITKVA